MELGGGCEGVVRWKWCGGRGGGNGGGSGVEEIGGALVNAVVALGEGTCPGVLSVGVGKSLILQGFSML